MEAKRRREHDERRYIADFQVREKRILCRRIARFQRTFDELADKNPEWKSRSTFVARHRLTNNHEASRSFGRSSICICSWFTQHEILIQTIE